MEHRDGGAALRRGGDVQAGVAVDDRTVGLEAHGLGAVVVRRGNKDAVFDHQAVGDAVAGIIGVAVDGKDHLGAIGLHLGHHVGHDFPAHDVGAVVEDWPDLRGLGIVRNGVAFLQPMFVFTGHMVQGDAVVNVPAPLHGYRAQPRGLGVLCALRARRRRAGDLSQQQGAGQPRAQVQQPPEGPVIDPAAEREGMLLFHGIPPFGSFGSDAFLDFVHSLPLLLPF